MDISNYAPKYSFGGINEIKPAMLKEAARNARIAASEFASNAGAKVGKSAAPIREALLSRTPLKTAVPAASGKKSG